MHNDLVLINAHCYTMNPAQPHASALVVRGGRIAYVGDDEGARASVLPGAEVVDLGGACVVPGLGDAHMHMNWYARSLAQVDVETPTLDEALARVAARVAQTPAGGWISGRGWNHNVWGGELPTAASLDRVASHHPVFLSAKSGHAGWVNSRALALAGITRDTPDPEGGEIVRDAAGEPTGALLEGAAMAPVRNLIPAPTHETLMDQVRVAMRQAHRLGLTCVHDMDGPDVFRAEQELLERGDLSIRIVKSIPLAFLDEAIAVGLRTGYGNDRLRIGQVKMFTDGALGPRTAWMLEGFETAPDNCGIPTNPIERVREGVLKANAAGLGAAIHAIGDRACREVIDIYQVSNARHPGLRNRVEHAQILHPDDQPRMARLGVVASMQPIHATSDMHISDLHLGERAAGAYCFRALLNHGTVLAFGSDCPVEVIDPLVGIHAAVTRRRGDGTPGPDGWRGDQRLTVEEAVRGFTHGAAYAAGVERDLGTLALGKLGDVTVLGADIFRIDPMEIAATPVLGTVVGGEFVWRADSL